MEGYRWQVWSQLGILSTHLLFPRLSRQDLTSHADQSRNSPRTGGRSWRLTTEIHSLSSQGHTHTAHWHLPGTKALWRKAKGRGRGPSAQWAVLRSCLLPAWPHSILQRPWRPGKSLSGGHHQGNRCFGSPATALPIPGSYKLYGMIWERPRPVRKPEDRNAVCQRKHIKQWQRTKDKSSPSLCKQPCTEPHTTGLFSPNLYNKPTGHKLPLSPFTDMEIKAWCN